MSTENYFTAFGLHPEFNVDLKKLSKAYRNKQQQTHPDRFAHEDAATQRQAVQKTALNNEMYQVLQSAVKRGHYLLSLEGIEFDLENYTVDDVDMLMNQLKYREQLNDIKKENNIDSLFDMQNTVTNKQQAIEQSLNTLFANGIQTNQADIKATLCELQFFNKLAYECDLVEEQLMVD